MSTPSATPAPLSAICGAPVGHSRPPSVIPAPLPSFPRKRESIRRSLARKCAETYCERMSAGRSVLRHSGQAWAWIPAPFSVIPAKAGIHTAVVGAKTCRDLPRTHVSWSFGAPAQRTGLGLDSRSFSVIPAKAGIHTAVVGAKMCRGLPRTHVSWSFGAPAQRTGLGLDSRPLFRHSRESGNPYGRWRENVPRPTANACQLVVRCSGTANGLGLGFPPPFPSFPRKRESIRRSLARKRAETYRERMSAGRSVLRHSERAWAWIPARGRE